MAGRYSGVTEKAKHDRNTKTRRGEDIIAAVVDRIGKSIDCATIRTFAVQANMSTMVFTNVISLVVEFKFHVAVSYLGILRFIGSQARPALADILEQNVRNKNVALLK